MKTEFLKELGLEQEVIDKIMAENGKDVKAEQDKAKQVELDRDNYKTQLETAQETLKNFDGVDVEKLNGDIQTLNQTLADKEKEYQESLAGMKFNSVLEKALSDAGARNAKSVMALLDVDALKGSKDQTADISAAIEAIKSDNDYLFGSQEPINNPTLPTGGGGGEDANTAALRAAMGLSTEKK